MTDKEQRAHDLAMLMLSHGINHLSADGQGFSFELWEKAQVMQMDVMLLPITISVLTMVS